MRTSLYIAWRYLFSKKTHNAVNTVSAISAAGVCVATAALVCVLSVLNGFNDLIEQMFSAFDPDLRITAVQGKSFTVDTPAFNRLKALPEVAVYAETIEENALVRYSDKQLPVTIKGVDTCFTRVTGIDSLMFDGVFTVFDGAFERCVPGVGLANRMGIGARFIDPIRIYAPKRAASVNILRPERSFNEASVFIAGIFSVQQATYDDAYMLVSLGLARELFDFSPTQVSAVELRLSEGVSPKAAKKDIQQLLGSAYNVHDRYEQQADFFRIVRIEKWMTFLILAFILLIATFNIIGSLSMLIIEKKADTLILRSFGADDTMLRRIFLFEGWLVSLCGASAGLLLGLALCLTQQAFGWLRLGNGYIIEAYPVSVQAGDIILIAITVLLLGFIAAWYPSRKANLKPDKH